MLQDHEIEQLFVDLDLPEKGRELVRAARRNSPVRSPTSKGGNIRVWHYSSKMGAKHLELESHTVEGEAAMLHEDDIEVLEFWAQPCRVDVNLKDGNGNVKGRQIHTPDFLVIRAREIVVEEWRMESRLLRLANEGEQFYKDDKGWHFRAAEEYFAQVGLKYHLRGAAELPHILIQNARFLQDYRSPSCPPVDGAAETTLLNLLKKRGSIPFVELIRDEGIPADDIFKCIVKRSVAANLRFDRLDQTSGLYIHRDVAIARAHHSLSENQAPIYPIPGIGTLIAGSVVTFNGKQFRVVLVGAGRVLLQDSDGQRIEQELSTIESLFAQKHIEILAPPDTSPARFGKLTDYTTDELTRAEMRLAIVDGSDPSRCSERSRQRWSGLVAGITDPVDRLLALVDRQANRGNDSPRLTDDLEALAKETIDRWYNTPTCRTAHAVWLKHQEVCAAKDITPMSYPTFAERVKTHGSVRSREGVKKEYQVTDIPLYLDYKLPLHGVRPHDVVHIDSTIATTATVGVNGAGLGKPTLTIATDGHTTQQRAMYLSYDPPSSGVVLMVLRDYVRRWGTLPRLIVVDGGSDLGSREIKNFCRIYGIDVKFRTGTPRGGAPVERVMGASEVEVFAQIEGNTRIMRNARMVTKNVNPFGRAEWTLSALYGAVDSYLFDIRENRPHPSLGVTPKQYEAMRLAETGKREHKIIRFDENLMLMTSPHSKRWLHKIDRLRGVWADNMYYWHDCLRSAKPGEQVEVRVEPWNANVIYVCFRGTWVAAIARDLRAFAGRHRREVEIALREERKRAKVTATKGRQSKVMATKMLDLWSPERFDELLGHKQREMARLYSRLGMTEALRHSSPTESQAMESDLAIRSESPIVPYHQQHDAASETPAVSEVDDDLWSKANDFI